MILNKGVLAAGILVVAGFCGGFLLSNGSGQALGMKPVHKAFSRTGKAGNEDEGAAAAIFNASQGDGQDAKKHPKINQTGGGGEGGAASVDGAADGASGMSDASGNGARTKSDPKLAGSSGDAQRHAAKPSQPIRLTGADAAAFLTGNTVDSTMPKQPVHLTFYAPRGLRADGDERGFVVAPWNQKSASICEPGSDGALVCRPLEVNGESGEHAPGTKIGTMLIGGDHWVPIYRGNLIGLPDHIPLVDSVVSDPEPDGKATKATAKGRAALNALIGHAASIDPPDGSADQPSTIVLYAPDGRRVATKRPEDGKDASDGLFVSVGRWTFANGLLCQSDGAPEAAQACFKPEARGGTSIRLVSAKATEDFHLHLVNETLPQGRQAAN